MDVQAGLLDDEAPQRLVIGPHAYQVIISSVGSGSGLVRRRVFKTLDEARRFADRHCPAARRFEGWRVELYPLAGERP